MMDLDYKQFCRLCSNHDLNSKDLCCENNKSILNLVVKYLNIDLNKNMGLPTKICSECETTLTSFESFVKDCLKTQDFIRMMCPDVSLKDVVKSEDIFEVTEVKIERSGEGSVSDVTDYDATESYSYFNEDSIDSIDDMTTIAQLKNVKSEEVPESELFTDGKKIKKDLVKMICHLCQFNAKNWTDLTRHCVNEHSTDPIVKCACGYSDIKSKSEIVSHIKEHKSPISKQPRIQAQKKGNKRGDLFNLVSFKCLICSKPCHNWLLLHKHSKKYHSTKPLQECNLCGMKLKSKSSVYRHAMDHRTQNVHRCNVCSKILTSAKSLKRHQSKHNTSGNYVCANCGKVLTSSILLKSHMKSHIPIHQRKVYECDTCAARFTTGSALVNHKRAVHEKLKRFVCDLCGFSCVTSGELKQHRAIHSEEKPFTCPKCDKKFKTHSNMKTHMDIHAETSYSCDICNKVLNSKRTLRKHILVHQTEKKYSCKQCNKAFKRSHTLKVHMAMHTGDKPVTCKWCGEKFTYSSSLRAHRLRFHPDKDAAAAAPRPTYAILLDGELLYKDHEKNCQQSDTQIQLGYKEEGDQTIMNKILNL